MIFLEICLFIGIVALLLFLEISRQAKISKKEIGIVALPLFLEISRQAKISKEEREQLKKEIERLKEHLDHTIISAKILKNIEK